MDQAISRGAIVYFSLTGHTERLALAIAARAGVEVYALRVARYRPGPLGYGLAGLDSLTGRLPAPTEMPPPLGDRDWVALGAPIWTSYPATPLRAYLAARPKLPPHVSLFLTGGDHSPPEKAVDMATTLLGRPFDHTLHVGNAIDGSGEAEIRVRRFAAALTGRAPVHPA